MKRTIALATLAACTLGATGTAQAATETVYDSDVVRQAENSLPGADWVLYERPAAPGTGAFASGPGTPLGTGSLQLGTTTSSSKVFLYGHTMTGTPLADVTALAYQTYRVAGSANQLPSLNMEVDVNGLATPDGWTTLVFEPVYNLSQQAVVTGAWQTWDAFSGNATWWSTRAIGGQCAGATGACDKTFSEIVANNPDAVVLRYGVNQGSGNPGLSSAVDALTFNSTTWDFEPGTRPAPPAPVVTDADGDGIVDAADCAPLNGSAPSKIGTDANCDGIADETQQPQQQTPPPTQSEASGNPAPGATGQPAGPTEQQIVTGAESALRDTPVTQEQDLVFDSATVFVPSPDEPTRRVPVVEDDTITIDRQGARRGTTQSLMAISSPDGDGQARVEQTVKIGNRTITLPVQQLTIAAGSAEPVKLPLTKAMRKALRNGQDVELTLTITVIDGNGKATTQTKTFTVKAEKPKKRK